MSTSMEEPFKENEKNETNVEIEMIAREEEITEEDEGEEEGAEVLRVQIQHLPKYLGMKQFKQFLRKMKISARKVKLQDHHGFFQLPSQEELDGAIKSLDGFKWKGSKLRARKIHGHPPAYPAQRPTKKEGEKEAENDSPVRPMSPNSLEQSMLDAVIPLRKVAYEEQLKQKEESTRTLFESVSKEVEIVSGVKLNGDKIYGSITEIRGVGAEAIRNKCEFTIGTGLDDLPAVGFKPWGFRKGGDCPIVSAVNCPHISPLMKTAIGWLEEFLRLPDSLPHFDSNSGKGYWRTMTVRDFSLSAIIILTLHPQQLTDEALTELKSSISKFYGEKLGDRKVSLFLQKLVNSSDEPEFDCLAGEAYAEEKMYGKFKFRISPSAFFQTCTKAAEILYTAIGEECGDGDRTEGVLLDICCGTGTIGISLAHRFKAVLGLEICAEAVQDARINAELNGVENCKFVRGKAEEVFVHSKHYLPEKWSSVTGILDPPRNGIPDKLIASVRRMEEMKTLIYVSCNPKAARKNFVDLCRRPSNKFAGTPFRIKKLIPVDMFPNTEHVEWIIVLER